MITKIKWKNHNILNNLELNFTKEDGTPYNTIVIAGENGTGKTTILDTIGHFFYGKSSFTNFDYIQYVINDVEIKLHYDQKICQMKRDYIRGNSDNFYNLEKAERFGVVKFGILYSSARSGFNTQPIKSITSIQIDKQRKSMDSEFDIDDEEDFDEIKQLIVDISAQDNSELSNVLKAKRHITAEEYEEFMKNSKISRFENAFNNFFEHIKYRGIAEKDSGEKIILFEKYGKEIPIDSLSTGEKQIVFRGSHLLRNQKILNGGVVLIDEPELSMHPLWQEKILKYYRDLFAINGKQVVQMIIATHSEYLIKNALKDKENVLVISLHDNDGSVTADKKVCPGVLPEITLGEINYQTFHIVSIDYHIQLYGFLQTLTGNHDIKKCDRYIENHIKNNHLDENLYIKEREYKSTVYKTLPTYIRNAIDHPDSGSKYSDEQLEMSIKLLIEMIKNFEK